MFKADRSNAKGCAEGRCSRLIYARVDSLVLDSDLKLASHSRDCSPFLLDRHLVIVVLSTQMLRLKIQLPPSPPMTPPTQLKMPTDPERRYRQAAGSQTSVPAMWLQASAGISRAKEAQSQKHRNTKYVVPSDALIPTELQQFGETRQPNNSDLFLVARHTPNLYRLPGHRPYSTPSASGSGSQVPDHSRDTWPPGQAEQADQIEDDDSDDADPASVVARSSLPASGRKEPKRRHRSEKVSVFMGFTSSANHACFRLTKEQTRILVGEYAKYAHPTQAQRQELSRRISGMSPRQVQIWFQNR